MQVVLPPVAHSARKCVRGLEYGGAARRAVWETPNRLGRSRLRKAWDWRGIGAHQALEGNQQTQTHLLIKGRSNRSKVKLAYESGVRLDDPPPLCQGRKLVKVPGSRRAAHWQNNINGDSTASKVLNDSVSKYWRW